MARGIWESVAALAGATLFGTALLGFGLFFSPGWANDWPGLPITTVWPAGMAVLLFLLLGLAAMVLAAGLAAGSDSGQGGRAFRICLIATLIPTAAVAGLAFVWLHAEALAMWPNGYNPGIQQPRR